MIVDGGASQDDLGPLCASARAILRSNTSDEQQPVHRRWDTDQRERIQGYDYSRIEAVLDMIITNCGQMREAVLDEA